ncbi:MAG TPA: VanW family protein [Gaiellaceae bacterium]
MAAHGSTTRARIRRRRRAGARATQVRLAVAVAGFAAIVLMLGFAFAGSPEKLAEGTTIVGIDVGGLSPTDARALLEKRAQRLANVPVTFTSGTNRWELRPAQLGVKVDWAAAVDAAQRQGGGFGPVRGYRRLEVRFFSGDLEPPVRVYDAALTYEISRIAARLDTRHREARLVRRGLQIVAQPGQVGRVLDQEAAASLIAHALASFERAPVGLPVRTDPPRVTVAALRPAQRLAQRAVSAPVTLRLGETRWRLPRWRLATMLQLPQGGDTELALRGPAANAYFARLARTVDRAPRDADFAVYADGVRIVPARPGISLDVPRTANAILAAAERPAARTAALVVETSSPSLTTAEARAMGIVGKVGVYETVYGGDPNRIHNVQLVAHLVDHKLIAPGSAFSFNGTTGERTAAKGFREAPVIINGELQTGLGGGICQVSTTIFNAAYEAGLPITSRTNHALYISHYPLGRDATVNYPNIDLRFVNNTGRWLLLRTFVGSSSLVAALYGTPVHRRVETQTSPLREVSPPPVERTDDPTLPKGETVVDDDGEPARTTSVRRLVYAPNGKLLSDSTWYSSYRAEPKLVRVGTKEKPKPEKNEPGATTTTQTTTTTETAPEPPH